MKDPWDSLQYGLRYTLSVVVLFDSC